MLAEAGHRQCMSFLVVVLAYGIYFNKFMYLLKLLLVMLYSILQALHPQVALWAWCHVFTPLI